MRVLLSIAALTALVACKDKQESAQASAAKPPVSAPHAPTPKPRLPAAPTPGEKTGDGGERPAPRPSKPVSIEDAKAVLPALEGREIIPLKQTTDKLQVHGTWCIDGTSAEEVAKQVAHSLAQAKYTGITIRGDARKAGVAADREDMRFSMVVSASSAQVCAAPAHYFASATLFRP
jgi:hypothetical protein